MAELLDFNLAKKMLFSRSSQNLESLIQYYEMIRDKEVADNLRRVHSKWKEKGIEVPFIIFDDSVQISRNWKTPGRSFIVDNKRTKRMTLNLDKRSIVKNSPFGERKNDDSIVKLRTMPFGAMCER